MTAAIGRALRTTRADPHVVLAAGSALAVAAEAGYRTWTSDAWIVLQAALAAAALLYAWRTQDRLRFAPVLALALAVPLAWIAVHLGVDVRADKDSSVVFRWQGNGLRQGHYPRSEYPVGAVLLFALEAWLGRGATRWANALLMVPCQAAVVAAVWACRTRLAPWLAAFVAVWPLNEYYWEFKFDLVPAALLAVGIVLALSDRWTPAGAVLGVGALVKWTPGFAAVVLAVWLVASGRGRDAARHGAAFVLTVVLVYVPFLVWNADTVLHAYDRQGARKITPESVWYLLLRPFDLAHVRTHISFSAGAPGWANIVATAVQLLLVAGLLAAAVRVRGRTRSVLALAALAPAAFLLTNRIFSPQFVVVLFAAWAIAGALVARTRRQQFLVGVGAAVASFGNAFVFPFALPHYDVTWVLCSALLFGVGLALTAWLAAAALAAQG